MRADAVKPGDWIKVDGRAVQVKGIRHDGQDVRISYERGSRSGMLRRGRLETVPKVYSAGGKQ